MGLSEMLGSALVQEAVSRVVSSVLGKRKERASQAQGHKDDMERLDMAILGMETALEMSANRPITNLTLLQTRKKIRCAYVQAKEMQRDKQKLLKAGDVARLERFADWAHKFVGDVESSCSLSRNNLCNNSIIVRHLLEGRSLRGWLVQGNQRRYVVDISASRSEERGFEALLMYSYMDENTTMEGKRFYLMLILRLSESTDVVGVAIKGLQYLASQFKLPAESAVGELTLLPSLLQGLAPSRVPWEVDDAISESVGTMFAQHWRPDPACCKASRLGLCSSNNSNDDDDVSFSLELSHIFPEEVIWFSFRCYISAAVEEPPNSRSMVEVSVFFAPHYDQPWAMQHGSLEMVQAGDVLERRDASLQHVSDTLKSDAISCFLRQPELTEYRIGWSSSRHGSACFVVERPKMQLTRRKYKAKCQEIDRCRSIGCASF